MGTNILCENKESAALSDLFEQLFSLLQGSDDRQEKEKLQKALKNSNNQTSYIVLGECQSGKTSLLHLLFQDILPPQDHMTGDICEYRWGQQNVQTPVSDGMQKSFLASDAMKGISIIDTKGIDQMETASLAKAKELASDSHILLAVFDVGNIQSPKLWDLLECLPHHNILCFLTKCDTISRTKLTESVNKLKTYMQESHITGPVFPVVTVRHGNMSQKKIEGIADWAAVRSYIREQIIGENPLIHMQQNNIEEIQTTLTQLQRSFSLRKKQYESDREILHKINTSLDNYIGCYKKTLSDFICKLTEDIHQSIDNYQQEIIAKMDPYKIKERFQTKEDFIAYLNLVNENYKIMMNDSINRKTIEAMKNCLHDLEILFQEAVGYFNQRENILALNDRFYGSLSQSRRQIVAETKNSAFLAWEFYQLMTDSSEDLFLKIWNERKKYESKVGIRKALSLAGGAGAGSMTGAAGAGSLAAWTSAGIGNALGSSAAANAASALAGVFVGSIAAAGLIGIGVIAGAFVVNSLAKKLYDPKAAGKMEKASQECIRQFKCEVEKARETINLQISSQITELFEKELSSVDGCFNEFRLSVNLEEQKLPNLEKKLLHTEELLHHIETMSKNKESLIE